MREEISVTTDLKGKGKRRYLHSLENEASAQTKRPRTSTGEAQKVGSNRWKRIVSHTFIVQPFYDTGIRSNDEIFRLAYREALDVDVDDNLDIRHGSLVLGRLPSKDPVIRSKIRNGILHYDEDWYAAARHLQLVANATRICARFIGMDGIAKLGAKPEDVNENSMLDFHILLEITIELDISVSWETLPQCRSDLARLLHFAFIETSARRYFVSETEQLSGKAYEETDIEWFYACLRRPAALGYSIGICQESDENTNRNRNLLNHVIAPPELHPTLLQFQSKSVEWMLSREGKKVAYRNDEKGKCLIEDIVEEEAAKGISRSSLWERVRFDDYDHIWLNMVTLELSKEDPADTSVRFVEGSIAAEEMGLGKTVEILALILLNTDSKRRDSPQYYVEMSGSTVQPSGQTLLVCPQAIIGQWQNEIERHAPSLRVLRYEGVKKSFPREMDLGKITNDYDLVICTFDVLRSEVTISRKPIIHTTRSNSHKQEHDRVRYKRSLLVSLDWLRVVIDEARELAQHVLYLFD